MGTYVCMCTNIHVPVRVHGYIYTFIYACIYVNIYTYVCVCIKSETDVI